MTEPAFDSSAGVDYNLGPSQNRANDAGKDDNPGHDLGSGNSDLGCSVDQKSLALSLATLTARSTRCGQRRPKSQIHCPTACWGCGRGIANPFAVMYDLAGESELDLDVLRARLVASADRNGFDLARLRGTRARRPR